jgi:hypothetical protein
MSKHVDSSLLLSDLAFNEEYPSGHHGTFFDARCGCPLPWCPAWCLVCVGRAAGSGRWLAAC